MSSFQTYASDAKFHARFTQATQGPKRASHEKHNVLIWRKPYHVTNSSHVIGNFLCKTLHCVHKIGNCA